MPRTKLPLPARVEGLEWRVGEGEEEEREERGEERRSR
jgi:hypothetical protein